MSEKLNNWRKELRRLTMDTGIREEEVCDYLDVSYSHITGWQKRTPVKRETLIGIGMAFRQDVDLINDWIVHYGDKRKLYAKDVLGDLVWIYLINAGAADPEDDTNYFRLYDACRDSIRETDISIWNEHIEHSKDTADVENDLHKVVYDPRFAGLRAFVVENIDSFKTAYSKPRKMLRAYVQAILDTHTEANDGQRTPVNFLRGYLDDSMINYVVGSDEHIHVRDMKSKDVTVKQRPIPKLRKTHIALCLALGMTTEEINTYLELMGYAQLHPDAEEDARLLKCLGSWEAKHPNVAKFKRAKINGETCDKINEKDSLQAVSDMLMLRSDLDYEYQNNGWDFPYMKG